MNELYDQIRPELDYEVKKLYPQPLKQVFKKNGDRSIHTLNYCSNANIDPDSIAGPFSRIEFCEPNLSSSDQIKRQLFKLGWKPLEWNYKKVKANILYIQNEEQLCSKEINLLRESFIDKWGFDPEYTVKEPLKTSPKLTEDSYDSLTVGIGPALREWMIYDHRLSQIQGFLINVREDQTIPSVVDGCGTPTARVRHKIITNIPRLGSVYGRESRELFRARPGRVLVGEDRSQIEARLIANVSIDILGDTKLADAIMGRDFHQVIFEALEGLCTSRQAAKTPEYAFFFGALEKKLGQSIDNKPREWSYEKAGTEVIKLMRRNIPGIIEVREALSEAAKRGWIMGLDGRKFFIRKAHAALNTYTQGNAQVCCKTAMIRQQEEAKKRRLDVMQVGYFHDETQNDCLPEHAEEFGQMCVQAIRDTGKFYKLHVPLDGEYSIGKNWRFTH